ncbi:hypothetical protein [Paraburkholderia kururiensis]|uniref:hypothetical protein n=1 Tax=Paraburkholderia kururiensis TaxID=984307 RepID=UPI000F8681FE|nr:hypothetical protein [Paraburkholderia kururiensis]
MSSGYIENRIIDGIMVGVISAVSLIFVGCHLGDWVGVRIEMGCVGLLLGSASILVCLLLIGPAFKIIFDVRHQTIFDGKGPLFATLCGRVVGIALGFAIAVMGLCCEGM